MRRKVIGALLALLLATAGTLTLLVYVRTAEERALAGERAVDVYVVAEPIARGTSADRLGDLVALTKVPAKVVPAGTVDRLDLLEGKVAGVDLVPGEQLLQSRFITPEELVAQTAVEIPEGLHQVTVALDPERALGGEVKPGDTVAVLASFDPFELQEAGVEVEEGESGPKTPNSTHIILHKVLVTNVQLQGGRTGTTDVSSPAAGGGDDEEQQPETPRAPTGQLLVTLAVDAPSVERVVFTAEHGFLWLSQEPEDAPEDGTRIQTRDTIYR